MCNGVVRGSEIDMRVPTARVCLRFNTNLLSARALEALLNSDLEVMPHALSPTDVVVPAEAQASILGLLSNYGMSVDREFELLEVKNLSSLGHAKAELTRSAIGRKFPYDQDADTILRIAIERARRYELG